MANAYAQYKTQSLSVMTQGELLVKLFDEVIKQCHLAKIGMEELDYFTVNESITKAQSILRALESALDLRYSVSENLHALYIFFEKQLLQANLRKDSALLDEILPLLKDLRGSFEQADRTSRSRHAVGGQAV